MVRRAQWTLFCLALALAGGQGRLAAAQEVQIVVHPSNELTSISREELSKIFLKRLGTWADGEIARPVDQPPDAAARARFSRLVHGRSVVTIEVYWRRMIFSGRDVPLIELQDDDRVLEYVRTHPGAVGYVSASAQTEGLRVLALAD